ncbi:hypothetical protein KC865_01400 [Candidatus Kaiserbacteria bacterium]|nr:hypothetical protein [Candidatus Kaiserbacteria bacterium]USN92639.1 MAG: hypothetical protein H6782_02395 [Candidatus Nomurabacteria bacterium]
MTDYSILFKKREQQWFERIKPFLFDGNADILKIGNGFGHLSEMIRGFSKSLKIYEIAVYENTVNKSEVILYDGKYLRLPEKSVDVTVFNLSFHHIPKNKEYLKNVVSLTKNRIIFVEETYDNLFQKAHLVWRDWYLNRKAGTPCRVFWRSYLKRSEVKDFFSDVGLEMIHRETFRHHSYYKELLVLDIV